MIRHAEQSRLIASKARHRVLAAGRGSGKTENAARLIVVGDREHRGALRAPNVTDPLYVIAAPTRDQVRSIWWKKMKAMCEPFLAAEPRETDLELYLKSGACIRLVGLDKPHRTEGIAIDGLVLDEMAEVKPKAWESSLEPTLNRLGRPGWALLIGRPKGRGQFYERWSKAKTSKGWDAFHWTSEPVLGRAALDEIAADCDPLTFRQEYLADWVTFEGLAYYQWDPNLHYRSLSYDPNRPLIVCLDFNVDPGVAAILQEQDHKHAPTGDQLLQTTCVIGEVHIPKNSNTPAVCSRILKDWGHHAGDVLLYGDPAGGARHTSQAEGKTDWQLVQEMLRAKFGDRLRMRVAKRAPFIRDRVNMVNRRLKTQGSEAKPPEVRFLVDPQKAPNVVKDFEGVTLLAGGSGEVDKKGAEEQGLSHLSEAVGYYVHEAHPIAAKGIVEY